MRKNPLGVMLSGAKHLVFSVTCEDEILRLSPQDDIVTLALCGHADRRLRGEFCFDRYAKCGDRYEESLSRNRMGAQ